MIDEGIIAFTDALNAPWYFASNSAPEARAKRLAELTAIYKPYLDTAHRTGQALEIATYRALQMLPDAEFYGRFRDLDDHNDSTLYRREEPPQHIGNKTLRGDERLDFLLRSPDAGMLGIECKNTRPWLYPHEEEIRDLLRKCTDLNAVPVLIARRIPFVTFYVLSACGVVLHQTYNQLMPATAEELANRVRDKTLLKSNSERPH